MYDTLERKIKRGNISTVYRTSWMLYLFKHNTCKVLLRQKGGCYGLDGF